MTDVPADTPDTNPNVLTTVVTAVLLHVQLPPNERSLSVVLAVTHNPVAPVIGSGFG